MGVYKRNQAKRAKYSNFCIFKTTNAIATKFCSDKDHQILVVGRPKICPTNPIWRTAAIMKKVDKLLYLSNGLTNFYEILHADACQPSKPYEMFKKFILKNLRWRTAAILKKLNAISLQPFGPILMKFGMVTHLSPPKLMENQELKISKSKMADGSNLEN